MCVSTTACRAAHSFVSGRFGTAKVFGPAFFPRTSFGFFPFASRLQVELTIVVKFGDLLFIPPRFSAAAIPATCMNSPGVRDKKSIIAFATLIFLYLAVLAAVRPFSARSSSTLSIASTFCLRAPICRCNSDCLKIKSSLVTLPGEIETSIIKSGVAVAVAATAACRYRFRCYWPGT